MFVVTKTKSKDDVLWQNGEKSLGLDPQSLSLASNNGDHNFCPDQFVLENLSPEDVIIPRSQKFGVVKSVDAHERTVKVKWFTPKHEQNIEFTLEIMSAYELIEHPDFSYSIGDVIFRCIPLYANLEENKCKKSTKCRIIICLLQHLHLKEIVLLDKLVKLETRISRAICHTLEMLLVTRMKELRLGGLVVLCPRQKKSHMPKSEMEDTEEDLSIANLSSMQPHEEENIPNDEATTSLLINDESRNAKQFDIVSDHSDHHFVNDIGNEVGQVKRGWLKKIQ